MSNRNKIIIAIIVILLIIIGIVVVQKKSNNKQNAEENVNINYDNETGLYYIKNEETGEIVSASTDESDLQFYKDNPDYNPNPLAPKSKDIKDFVNMGNPEVNY